MRQEDHEALSIYERLGLYVICIKGPPKSSAFYSVIMCRRKTLQAHIKLTGE